MLTQQQILDHLATGAKSNCLDGRDFSRLADFFPVEQVKLFGFEIVDPGYTPYPWTEAEITDWLASDVAFGFEKALNRRGISASLMNDVVKMWLWVLEDPLADSDQYAQYGLPLLKQVAVKYGFPNEIGDDDGDEAKYSAEYGND
jgi:hypothetical protein